MNKVLKVILGILYWIISLTWGGIMTIIGLITAAICLLFVRGATAHRNGFSFIVELGGNWGGISLGAVALCGGYSGRAKYDSNCVNSDFFEHTRRHEFGHSIQNIIMGPFFIFVVALPSLVRSWLYNTERILADYDDIWFEYQASKWGHKWVNMIEGTNVPYMYVRPKRNK